MCICANVILNVGSLQPTGVASPRYPHIQKIQIYMFDNSTRLPSDDDNVRRTRRLLLHTFMLRYKLDTSARNIAYCCYIRRHAAMRILSRCHTNRYSRAFHRCY